MYTNASYRFSADTVGKEASDSMPSTSGKSKVDENSGCASINFKELAVIQRLATLVLRKF